MTSLCELRSEPTVVRFCMQCGHAQTDSLKDAAEFYESEYRILIDSDDEDQVYEVRDAGPVYRLDYQAQMTLEKIALPDNARVLEFGAAKGASIRKLSAIRNDIVPYVFDVSRMYQPFWEKFLSPDQWQCYAVTDEWNASFDAVVSYFVLEHVADLAAALATVHRVLKP